jgi:nucleotide-binding universal stress UspA family protein
VGTILCGVDSSDGARQALRVAVELAARLRLRLVVVHVVDLEPLATVAPAVVRAAEEALGRLVVETDAGSVEIRVAAGAAAQRLAEIADDEGAQMIIIGSRTPRRWPSRNGRLARTLARVSASAVLVVPAVVHDRVGRTSDAQRAPMVREMRQRTPILPCAQSVLDSNLRIYSSSACQPSGIVSWRREQLLRAGLPLAVATTVASIPLYDVHEVVSLIGRGCAPELAVQILAPLEERLSQRHEEEVATCRPGARRA